MSFGDLSTAGLLAACGGDAVKLFDLTVDSGDDPCTLSYTPTVGSQVNSVKWNHTNLVVASAGDDKKISRWHKNGHILGTVPLSGSDAGVDESIFAINFSNKGSRYLCSGGSGSIVRIWDLQRKRCIKWLSGHRDTITGIMYHFLVLRVLDYSRHSRHVLVTAGDDGSVHLWDTNGRSAKASWLKQHSAPTTGVCFSPSSDKIIASVGLDKKLYTFDLGTKRPISCSPYEAPFSSLAYRDNGYIIAAGTNSGRVVFYDVRGKPQPFTVLRAYNSSVAVTSLCWQRSKHVVVNENSCNAEIALLGGSGEDSILMPDPLPSLTGLSFTSMTSVTTTTRSSLTATTSGSMSTTSHMDTPQRSHLREGGPLSKLQTPRTSHDLKDDMDVFSPLVDVQPITPPLSSWWDDSDEVKKDGQPTEKKSSLFPSATGRFPYSEGNTNPHPISDWRFPSTSRQDDTPPSTVSQLGATPAGILESSSSFQFSSASTSLGTKSFGGLENLEFPAPAPSILPLRFTTYAERARNLSSLSEGTNAAIGSPKLKKPGAETREELMNIKLSRQQSSAAMAEGSLPETNGVASQSQHGLAQPTDQQQGSSSFSLQLVQRPLEESLESVQMSKHEDVRNLHIDLLRQFHMQEVMQMEMSSLLHSVLEKQDEMMKEFQSLRKENEQLRQLL